MSPEYSINEFSKCCSYARLIEKIQSLQEIFSRLLALLVRSIELRQVVEISGSFK